VHVDDKSKVNIMLMPMVLAAMPKQAKQGPLDKFFTTAPKGRGCDLGEMPSRDHAIHPELQRMLHSATTTTPATALHCHLAIQQRAEDDGDDNEEEEVPELQSLLAERRAETRNPPRPPEGPPPRRARQPSPEP
jgi:hypothetical protein